MRADESSEEKVLSDIYELDDKTRGYHESHKELLRYLAKKKSPARGWSLFHLKFTADSANPDTAEYMLWGHFISRSRYNPKFVSVSQRHIQEWVSCGVSFLETWSPVFPELKEAGAGIKITVEYKYKKYLRSNERLKKGTLTFILLPEEITGSGSNLKEIYNHVLKRLSNKVDDE